MSDEAKKEIIETEVKKGKLRFDPNNHIFTLIDKKGEETKLLSVTAIVGIVDKSGPLLGWATNLARDYLLEKLNRGEQIIPVDVTEAVAQYRKEKKIAQDVGTKIHELVSKFIKKEIFNLDDVDDKVRNGFNAFLAYQDENKINWLESEKIVYSSKYNYAGITDAIGQVGRDRVLFEFKSTRSIDYPEFFLQTAAYQLAYEEQFKKKINYRLVLGFGKDTGEFMVKKLEGYQNDKMGFLACVALKQSLKQIQSKE